MGFLSNSIWARHFFLFFISKSQLKRHKNVWKLQQHDFSRNFTSSDFPSDKFIFSRFRGLGFWKILSKMLSKIIGFLGHRFGRHFERVLGGFWDQKHRFSYFFHCFFEAFFEQRFGKLKNWKETPNKGTLTDFWVGPAECAACWGEKKRGGRRPKM